MRLRYLLYLPVLAFFCASTDPVSWPVWFLWFRFVDHLVVAPMHRMYPESLTDGTYETMKKRLRAEDGSTRINTSSRG